MRESFHHLADFASGPEQAGNQSRPAGLVRRSNAASSVAVKVFVEQNVVFEMRIGRKLGMIFQHGPLAVFAFQKYARQPAA